MLHTVNKSPLEKNSLETCLRLADSNSSILLIEDGVYGALKNTLYEKSIIEAQKNNKFYVQAGAGIVADSKPTKEYEETVNKAKALLNALK